MSAGLLTLYVASSVFFVIGTIGYWYTARNFSD